MTAIWPDALPLPLAEGHAFEPVDLARTVEMDSGHARRRRLFRSAPQVCAVSWRFTQAQFDAFFDFFEGELGAGARQFDVLVAAQGQGLDWWTARFVEPYEAEALHGGRWSVQARLRLTGRPVPDEYAQGMRRLHWLLHTEMPLIDVGADSTVANSVHHLLHVELPAPHYW